MRSDRKMYCEKCNKFYFNKWDHYKGCHTPQEVVELMKEMGIDPRFCRECGVLILPTFARSARKNIRYDDKVSVWGSDVAGLRILCPSHEKNYRDLSLKEWCFHGFGISYELFKTLEEKCNAKKSPSKESYTKKFGKEDGEKRYNERCRRLKGRYTKNWYIEKYGKELGDQKYNDHVSKSRVTRENLIKKYGEKEGEIRWEKFRQKCSIFSESRRNQENYEDQFKKWKNRIKTTSLEYFLLKSDGDLEKARKMLAERQSCSLKKFLKKYGEKEGTIRYDRYLKSKLVSFSGRSGLELKFFSEVYLAIKDSFKKIYFGDRQYMFFTDKDEREKTGKKVYVVDFYIKDLNLIIELYGDFWHMNPAIYDKDDINTVIELSAEQIWEENRRRKTFLENKYKSRVLVVWENEVTADFDATKNKIVNYILNYGKN